MKSSERLDRLPPYLFAELERKIAEQVRGQAVQARAWKASPRNVRW